MAELRSLAFGFESGSDRVLKRIKKGATVAQARRAVAWARKYDFTRMRANAVVPMRRASASGQGAEVEMMGDMNRVRGLCQSRSKI